MARSMLSQPYSSHASVMPAWLVINPLVMSHVLKTHCLVPPAPPCPPCLPRSFLAARDPALCGTLTATSSPTATSWRRPRRSPSRCLTAPTPRQRECSVLMPATVLNGLPLNIAVGALRSSAVTLLEQGAVECLEMVLLRRSVEPRFAPPPCLLALFRPRQQHQES